MATAYDERPPSPISQKVGVLLELAVLSEPICRLTPHVPLSSWTRFVVQTADAEPAKRLAMPRAQPTATSAARRRPEKRGREEREIKEGA